MVKPEHYQRFKGEVARIQMLAPVAGRRRFHGVLLEATDDEVSIDTADGVITLPLADIDKAKLVPNFDKEKTGS